MKKVFALLSISILMMGFFSCKKKETVNNGSITATINGSTFQSSSVSENAASGVNYTSYGFTATDTNKTTLTLFLDTLSIGTYGFGEGFSATSIQYYSNGVYYYTSKLSTPTPGSIIITSTGANSISGTFSGTLYAPNTITDSVVISNGAFTNCLY